MKTKRRSDKYIECRLPYCPNAWEELYSQEYPICPKHRSEHRRLEQEGKMSRHVNGRLSNKEIKELSKLKLTHGGVI